MDAVALVGQWGSHCCAAGTGKVGTSVDSATSATDPRAVPILSAALSAGITTETDGRDLSIGSYDASPCLLI